jgi:succinate dehydrogenase/fumarate reductase flavoprotein subunit
VFFLTGERIIETDVLVLGGGLAGCMAAIRASEHGVDVTVVEKSHVERSGAAGTGNDHFWHWNPEIHPEMGWKVPDMVRDITGTGEYGRLIGGYIDQELCEIVAEGSYEAVQILERLGVQFRYDEIFPWNLDYDAPEGEPRLRIVPQFQSIPDTLNYDGRDIKKRLAEECERRGVHIFNRVMATSLLTKDDRVVGATGVDMRTGEFRVFKAKTVVMATGMDLSRLYRSPSGDWFNSQRPPMITGDGEAMALQAGVEVFLRQGGRTRNAGFQHFRNLYRSSGTATTSFPAGKFVNSEGDVMIEHPAVNEPLRKYRENVEASIQEGKTPFYLDMTGATEEEVRYAEWSYGNEGLCWVILEILKDLGLDFRRDLFELDLEAPGRLIGGRLGLFIDTECRTSLQGLFAGSPVQPAGEVSAPIPTVLGWRAGDRAAKHAREVSDAELEMAQVDAERQRVMAPLERGMGVSWREMNNELNNVMEHYKRYINGFSQPPTRDERSMNGLKTSIGLLERLREQPLHAADPHELVRGLEVLNLIDIGIALMRAALDPRQFEAGSWFLGRKMGDEMVFRVKPIEYKYPVEVN